MQALIAELIFSTISLLFSLSLFIYTFFSDVQMAGGGVEHSAMFFPRIIIGIMVALSSGMIVEAIVKARGLQARQNWKTLIGAIILVGFFIYFFKTLGFIITAFIFIIGYGYLLGYRKKLFLIITAAFLSLVNLNIFNNVLEISLLGLPWSN